MVAFQFKNLTDNIGIINILLAILFGCAEVLLIVTLIMKIKKLCFY